MKTPPCQFNRMLGKMKMLSMEARTTLSLEDLAGRLEAFFGKGGLGLGVKVDCPGRLTFEGGGGYVAVNFYTEGNRTLLKIVTDGWAVQVKTFVSELP